MTTLNRPPKAAVIVAQRIVRDISRDGLGVGDSLPPEHLMLQRYGMSRTTLREALRLLEFEGIVGLRHGSRRGPVVLSPDASSLASRLVLLMQVNQEPLQTVVQACSAIEPMLSGLAARRIDDAALDGLRETVECLRDNLACREAFQDASKRFHDIIVRASGNALFGHLVESFRCIMEEEIGDDDLPIPHRLVIISGHEEVLSALVARDVGRAEERMREHVADHELYMQSRYPHQLHRVVPWESSLAPVAS